MGTTPFEPNKHLHFSPLLRTQSGKDSDGRSYALFVQNEEQSCGLAAAAMLINLVSPVPVTDPSALEAQLKLIAANFPASLAESDRLWARGEQEFGSGLYNIQKLLLSQGIYARTVWRRGGVIQLDPRSLNEPAIVLWGWYPNGIQGVRKGGHFTVAASVTKSGKIVILDPWGGVLTEVAVGGMYKSSGQLDAVIYTRSS